MNSQNQKIKTPLKVAICAALGSAFEYYDFIIYGMMAKYLSIIFFASNNEFLALIQAFAIFSVGYIARPCGGIILASYADRYGRKKIFLITTLLMSIATVGIGLLPTYKQVGIIAPLLLLFFRIIQGISLGSEIPGATAITAEHGDKSILGRLCGIMWSGTSLGAIMAVSVLTILTNLYSLDEIIDNNIWRIPFLLGGLLAILCYYIRNHIEETPEFLAHKSNLLKFDILDNFKENKTNLILGFGMIFYFAVLVIINIYFPVFISNNYQYDLPDIYSSLAWSQLSSFLAILIFGYTSDYYCKYKAMRLVLILSVIMIMPMHLLLSSGLIYNLVIFLILYQIIIAIYFTSALPIISRLFPTKIRCTSIAIVYNFAFMVTSAIPSLCSLEIFSKIVSNVLFAIILISIAISFWANLLLKQKLKNVYAY